MMTANEIRSKFLKFFEGKNHRIIASDSLVPKDDPTVLFTTAGMQQFKRQFLGHIDGYTRAATSQKCLRTDDLDKVGKTPCHHTFFEMLGNFSFGDYFKKDAIAYAWEFLTKEMKLSAEKLWVSVYEEDAEAYDEWVKMGFPKEKIVKLGDKDNFWPAEAQKKGPNGPCGPCSEIFFDYGVNPDCKSKRCDPSCSCGRFTEVWNLVFTQFNRKDGGVLEPLPGKNIDTGMGLERLTAVVQGKKNNYETDLFAPILKSIDEESKKEKITLTNEERFVIADHIRAIVFGVSDGVIPSNEGRGYVMRRLIVESTDIVIQKGIQKPLIYKFVNSVIEAMNSPYSEIVAKANDIAEIIKKAEEAYIKVQKDRVPELEKIFKENKNDPETVGKNIFLYKDTYGLTIPTITTIALSSGISPEIQKKAFEHYENLMSIQQEKSRASSKMTGDRFADIQLNLAGTPKTRFFGYMSMEDQGSILKIFLNDKEVNQASSGDHIKIILDQTPFYAESGGQIGDTGYLNGRHGKVRILDTKKQDDIYIHFGTVEQGFLKINETVQAKVDKERRLAIMRNHTATHLLQSALRTVLGGHVQQQGSLVAEDRLRFDFTNPKAVAKDQLTEIENKINGFIGQKDKVIKEEMSLEEAKKKGALAFFAEKYKDRVRVITIGDYSKEFCGGTHVDSTGEIGRFVISSEGAVAQGIRRIEARTGTGAQEFIQERERKIKEQLEAEKKREQEAKEKKELDRQRLELIKTDLPNIIEKAETVNNTKVIVHTFPDSDGNQLREISDLIKKQVPSVIACSGSTQNISAAIVVGVSADLVAKGIKANEVIKDIATLIEGNGGGRPDLAQAGGKDPSKLKPAMDKAREILKKALSK